MRNSAANSVSSVGPHPPFILQLKDGRTTKGGHVIPMVLAVYDPRPLEDTQARIREMPTSETRNLRGRIMMNRTRSLSPLARWTKL